MVSLHVCLSRVGETQYAHTFCTSFLLRLHVISCVLLAKGPQCTGEPRPRLQRDPIATSQYKPTGRPFPQSRGTPVVEQLRRPGEGLRQGGYDPTDTRHRSAYLNRPGEFPNFGGGIETAPRRRRARPYVGEHYALR